MIEPHGKLFTSEGEDASEDGDAAEDPNAEQPGLDQEVQGGNNNQVSVSDTCLGWLVEK